ncbi:MAG: oxygenase MpaB family protein [Gordonia sp. (in: high G+C Gram-positive bacteria)]|uniref:oxygenase MpaB family protein n=1 Tax=Gordonia sp. (in: high G+C Gram-positive bacteria) TaxID=84139 RepID=UPI0039E5860C
MTSSPVTERRSTPAGPPQRFGAAQKRGRRLGRMLRTYWHLQDPSEEQLALIGERMMQRDEPAAALVRAMRLPEGDENRVSMRDFHTALAHGVPDCAPQALRDFFATVENTPDWVDLDLCNRGAAVNRSFGRNASDVLLQLGLIGGYRFGGPVDLLAETGGLRANTAKRRIGETQTWAIAVAEHDGMRRFGEGWKLTVHVRLMHALVNDNFERNGRWDIAKWGLPINQADLAGTLDLFSGALLMGVRALGVPVNKQDSAALMHLWKYVGWLIGVDDDWLFDDERDQHQLSYNILVSQGDVTEAGAQLSNAIVDVQRDLAYKHVPALASRYERERLLSMLEGFLGPRSMRDLRLPQRPPWAFAAAWARNTVNYRIVGRTPLRRPYYEWLGRRARDLAMYRHFGSDDAEIGKLPV